MSDNHAPARRVIQENLVASALELFADYGLSAEHKPNAADVSSLDGEAGAAIIGYGGDAMRGALVLLASRDSVKALVPEAFDGELGNDDEAIRDQLGEFSNMLLGRLKNHLLVRGVTLMLATPTTAFGNRLRVPPPAAGHSTWQEFQVGPHRLFVRLDATLEPGFTMTEPSQAQQPLLIEGEMMMF